MNLGRSNVMLSRWIGESGLHDARWEAGADRLRGLHEATEFLTMQITGGDVMPWDVDDI